MSRPEGFMGVAALGYLGLRGPDLAEWRSFALEVLGLQPAPESDAESLFLRMDERAYRRAVERGKRASVWGHTPG